MRIVIGYQPEFAGCHIATQVVDVEADTRRALAVDEVRGVEVQQDIPRRDVRWPVDDLRIPVEHPRGLRGCVIKGDHQLVEPLVELIELDHPAIANPRSTEPHVPSDVRRRLPIVADSKCASDSRRELCMIREIRAEVPDRSGVHRSASRTERPEVGVAQRDRPEPDVSSLVQPTE